jgi:hypothetical protein
MTLGADDSDKNGDEKGLVTYVLLSTYLLPKEMNGLLIGMVIFCRCF